MVQVKDLTELTVKDLWKEVKGEEDWWGDLGEIALRALKRLLEESMEGELAEQLRAGRYIRTGYRRGYRNGYRYRDLLTRSGMVERLRIPLDREGEYKSEVISRYQRRQKEVDRMVREMFLSGVSTRRVGEVIRPLLGVGVSAQTVSRITRSLDEEVKQYHRRALKDRYVYLLLDGITLKVKSALGVRERLVLCACGIDENGKRELISFRQATAESEAQWEAFLRELYERGLKGLRLRLITTDGCPGLHKALERAFREVRRRTRPMTCFQDSASVDRIIFGVICHLNNSWQDKPLPQFTHNT